ncbi:MAG: rhodanese-like domain-containing protein [Archaeoglobaceae archaeon]
MSVRETGVDGKELLGWVKKANNFLIDARPIDAFNGWAMKGEPRGGHIPGALSFPLSWLEYNDWLDILEDKNISKGSSIVVYGYDWGETEFLGEKLVEAGYDDVSVYNHFFEWSSDSNLPLERLPRYEKLVYPEWVKILVDGGRPPSYESNEFVIGHASYGFREDYEKGHIPGAIHIDTLSLEDPKTWNRRSPEELERALLGYGITSDTTVILYGRYSHPNNRDPYPGMNAGHLAAMRCAVIMLYAGVNDVRILNGGLNRWEAEGYSLTTDEGKIRKAEDFGVEIPAHPEYIIDTPEAKQLLASHGELVSVRSWDEYIGNVSGYNYISKKGRIPGSIFGNNGSDAYHMENYRNLDNTMRQYTEIAENWAENHIIPEKHVAFYCGTGWRASEAFLNAYLMTWPHISIYDGGWFEWSSDENNPIETGIPQNTVFEPEI